MGVPATEETDLVRLKEMREMIAGLNAADSRVVLTSPFDAAYNASGKTLTQNTPEELVIDGITLDEGDRVLIAKQLDASQNGVYVVTTLGVTGDTAAVLTRAADFNESHEFINGLVFPVLEGNANAGTRWKLRVGAVPFVIDAATINFTKNAVDFSRVVEASFPIIGDASTTVFSFAHNWNTLKVTHEIYDPATGETVVAAFRRVDSNNVEVRVGLPLGVGNNLECIIRAEVDPV
uniref:Tail fiber protein n=1 Tax=uncultured bacterium contig00055 TaxID=1181539 RepID=A0A806K1M4_9BACT|nr:hypothetical protein [uncultured bacterium contig00055]